MPCGCKKNKTAGTKGACVGPNCAKTTKATVNGKVKTKNKKK